MDKSRDSVEKFRENIPSALGGDGFSKLSTLLSYSSYLQKFPPLNLKKALIYSNIQSCCNTKAISNLYM